MRPIAVVASGVVSPLGEGAAGVRVGALGDAPGTAVAADPVLTQAGLVRPRAARVGGASPPELDRAAWLLERAGRALASELEQALPGWRERRVGLFIGTSGGGMPSLERALALRATGAPVPRALARAATYAGPLASLDGAFEPAFSRTQILAACASSTVAIGLACRALDAGDLDLAIAGGYDALSTFIATGFEALGATTASSPRPFRRSRDGMALGEGAALVALARSPDAPARLGTILGFGTTSDAVHVTAPDPTGRGLTEAARLALSDAGLTAEAIELVSAHATATPHNDSAETMALTALFDARDAPVVVHPYKATIGHTLGAAGALESLAALGALSAGVLPAAFGEGELEPGFFGRLLEQNLSGDSRHCLKLSAAFGGTNAALVLGHPSTARTGTAERRPAHAPRITHEGERILEPDVGLIRSRTRLDDIRIERLDRATALALTAVARALDAVGPLDPERTAVIVGTVAASLEANELFDARRRQRGPHGAEPRRFPATSPNLPAGVCSIAFGFHGPSFAVGGGPGAAADALRVATALIRDGDADIALVVSVNDVGRVVTELFAAAGLGDVEDGARVTVVGV